MTVILDKKFSIMTGMYWNRPILETFENLIAAGFRSFEIWGHASHFDYMNKTIIDRLLKLMENHNLFFSAYHIPSKQPFAFDTFDKSANNQAIENICNLTNLFKILKIDIIVMHCGNELTDNYKQQREIALENLKIITEHFLKNNISIAFENTLPHHLGGKLEDFNFFIENLKYPNAGWCIDTSHAYLSGKLDLFFSKFKDKIIHTHLSDNFGKYDDHFIPEEANINFSEIYNFLLSSEYKGVINFEVLNSKYTAQQNQNGKLEELLKNYILQRF